MSILDVDAKNFAKANKKIFINQAISGATKNQQPVAIFMAGTPGAGKTEVATSIMELFSPTPARIDADEFRKLFPAYNGSNSSQFQGAAAMMVDKVLEYVLGDKHTEPKYSFILDGTFAFKNATMNIKRSLTRGFDVQVYFVYQSPVESWRFTREREKKEGRNVPLDIFINAYYVSRKNIIAVKKQFGDKVKLRVIVKDYEKATYQAYDNVQDIEKIIPKLYNEEELRKILSNG